MKQLQKNKWLLIGLSIFIICSSLGNSLSVIAETLNSFNTVTSDTLDEQKSSTDMGVENKGDVTEASFQEKVLKDSEIEKLDLPDNSIPTSTQENDRNKQRKTMNFEALSDDDKNKIKSRIKSVAQSTLGKSIFKGSVDDLPTSLPSLGWDIDDEYSLDIKKVLNNISIENGYDIAGNISLVNEPEFSYSDSALGFMHHSYDNGILKVKRLKKGFINKSVVSIIEPQFWVENLLYKIGEEKVNVIVEQPITIDSILTQSGARGPKNMEIEAADEITVLCGQDINEELLREKVLKSVKIDNKLISKEGVSITFPFVDTSKEGIFNIEVVFRDNYSMFVDDSRFPLLEQLKIIRIIVEKDEKLTAEAVSQECYLGNQWDNVDLNSLVSNIQLGGKQLDKSDYMLELIKTPVLDYIGETSAQVKATYKKDTSKSIILDVPVKVIWGNSVVFGSYDMGGNGRTSAAFTLHTFERPIITASQGKGDDDSRIHSYFPNDLYYSFNLFDMKDKERQLIDENQLGDKYIRANGGDLKKTKLNDWGSGVNRQQAVNYGDVVRAWQKETSKNWLYKNEEKKTYNNGKQAVYYEITKEGYKPLQINFATTKKQKISIDTTDEEINNQISHSIDLPIGLDAKFVEYPSRDKAGDASGVIRVSQVLESGKKVEYDYDVPFEIVNDRLVVETKNSDVLLGTKNENIKVNDFISSVKLGDVILKEEQYTTEIIGFPDTSSLGIKNIKLKVSLAENTSKKVESSANANIVWGSTIVVKSNSLSDINASVSLLDFNGSPYLNANGGTGFRNVNLTSRPHIKIKRESDSNTVLDAGYYTVGQSTKQLADMWNKIFESARLEYGDVLTIKVNQYNGGANWLGKNTFISRNNVLKTETTGFEYAYYELTSNGYRLMHLNQLSVINNNKVQLGTSKEEMNKNIHAFLSIPSHITNSEDYRMEFDSVDTDTAGKKTTTINVYEKLQTGGEFKTTYQVNYTVNPRVEESSFDEDGQSLSEMKQTDFDFGTKFTPNPAKYLTKDNDLYVYKGWLSDGEVPGTDTPNEGSPSATETTKKYYYIYEKADKYINVTIPTEMVFGTYENTEKVTSKSYQLKNNSNEFTTKVTLDKFEKVKSDVNLLGESEDEPTSSEKSAKLSLLVEGKPLINGLNESVENKEIVDLMPASTANLSIDGKYFGDKKEKNIVEYNTKLKFKSIEGNK